MTTARLTQPDIVGISEARGDFYKDVDGFFYWCPLKTHGSLTATHLRQLADELDRRNADWKRQVDEEIGAGTQQHTKTIQYSVLVDRHIYVKDGATAPEDWVEVILAALDQSGFSERPVGQIRQVMLDNMPPRR